MTFEGQDTISKAFQKLWNLMPVDCVLIDYSVQEWNRMSKQACGLLVLKLENMFVFLKIRCLLIVYELIMQYENGTV